MVAENRGAVFRRGMQPAIHDSSAGCLRVARQALLCSAWRWRRSAVIRDRDAPQPIFHTALYFHVLEDAICGKRMAAKGATSGSKTFQSTQNRDFYRRRSN